MLVHPENAIYDCRSIVNSEYVSIFVLMEHKSSRDVHFCENELMPEYKNVLWFVKKIKVVVFLLRFYDRKIWVQRLKKIIVIWHREYIFLDLNHKHFVVNVREAKLQMI